MPSARWGGVDQSDSLDRVRLRQSPQPRQSAVAQFVSRESSHLANGLPNVFKRRKLSRERLEDGRMLRQRGNRVASSGTLHVWRRRTGLANGFLFHRAREHMSANARFIACDRFYLVYRRGSEAHLGECVRPVS